MNIVADTSIFLAVALNEPEKELIIDLTSDKVIMASEILPYEIGNALTAMLKRKQITQTEAEFAYNIVGQIPVRLMKVDIAMA